ncbi:hypothetical protein AQUCO_10800049v1 [Aquilegia coerulea]|uniref:Protein XRI1 n=1 Tax=Aquilegia coerulea TaxID=218851 RepID=A0A2G5C3D6_AQUCA|nr:hypothetical protein AQUCO_10800049v1 [Aquilegia coerulea]
MDYSNNNNNNNELWEWNDQNLYLPHNSHLDIPRSMWEGDRNDQLSYMLDDETTPVKACGDLAYNILNSEKNTNKLVEECKGFSSRVKRRRMLQFNTHSTDSLLCNENTQYAFENSKDKEELMEDASPENIQWELGFTGGKSASGNVDVDQTSEAWISNCFNDGGMQLSSDDMNVSAYSDDAIDISDEVESNAVPLCPTPCPKIIYKGRKSYIRTPTNLASSVAYPFALIKPCGVHGDVTLKDINQRILSPAPSISQHDKEEISSVTYPTSAFSGKPVVVKTKIRTEGGKGSITIMRTKG